MSTPSFRFKQFEVFHDRCGMKVGTDGVLLGAWVQPNTAKRILDIGTGSGLIALIMAQRSNAQIVGIDIDIEASNQANENAKNSPWSDRIRIVNSDLSDFKDVAFDFIVSNPPFFQQSLQSPALNRNRARHDVTLSYEGLISKAAALLSSNGLFCVIIPKEDEVRFEEICWDFHLYKSKSCNVYPKEGVAPKRVMLEFSTQKCQTIKSEIILSSNDGKRSTDYSRLTADLYL